MTHIVSSQIRLQFAREDLQRSALSDTIRANKTQDLARARCRQTMQLEYAGSVAVRHLRLQVRRQVDDSDSLEGAPSTRQPAQHRRMTWISLLDADTAADAQELGDEGDLVARLDLNAQFA